MSELGERPPRPDDMSPSYSLFAERAWAYMLHIEAALTQLRTELAEAVRLLKRVTEELNRFHLNEKKWIGNPFECPICRMIESAKNGIKRQEAK